MGLLRLLLKPLSRYVVNGESMAPTLLHGQRLLVACRAYRRYAPRLGDIVVLREPTPQALESVKRVVGLPGETVRMEQGRVSINGVALDEPYLLGLGGGGGEGEWRLGPDQFFVLGDNRARSIDSRAYGPVGSERLVGRAWFRYGRHTRWRRLRRGAP
ncbi:MAG: signal peptidase I [Chloroflexota bacterium]|nr:signal peptidase I [Chloroflexota bacterium]